jgi:hypothetical protein
MEMDSDEKEILSVSPPAPEGDLIKFSGCVSLALVAVLVVVTIEH